MKKLFIIVSLLIVSKSWATTSQVFNSCTGCPDFVGAGGGSATLPLPPGDTNYIRNTSTLQSGATFYVSSGTVAGPLSIGTGVNSYILKTGFNALNFNTDPSNSYSFNFGIGTGLNISNTQALFGGYLSLGDRVAPSGASFQGQLWSDSTSHWITMLNGATATDYSVSGTSTTNTAGHVAAWSGNGVTLVDGGTGGGGSTVLQSSGIAFGSSSNTVTSDTNSFTFNPANETLSISAGGPSSISVSSGYYNSSMNKAGFVRVSQHYAFVSGASSGTVTVFDVANTTSPIKLTQITGINGAEGMDISWPYLYVVAMNDNKLLVYNISIPGNPSLVGSLTDAINLGSAEDIHIAGNYAYVNNFAVGGQPNFTVVDVTTPSAPTIAGTLTDSSLNSSVSIVLRYPYAYVTGGTCNVNIIDISTPTAPTRTSTLSPTGCVTKIMGADYYGKYLYAAGFQNSAIYVIDVSTPSSPISISSITTGSYTPFTLKVFGDKLFFTSYQTSSIVQYSLSNPSSPTFVNVLTDTNYVNTPDDIFINGSNLYITTHGTLFSGCGFTVLNVGATKTTTLIAGGAQIDDLEVGHDLRANRILAQTSIDTNSLGVKNLSAGSFRSIGLNTCGDSSHGVSYSTITGHFGCQTITGTASSPGGSSGNIQYNNAGNFDGLSYLNASGTTITDSGQGGFSVTGLGGISISSGTRAAQTGYPLNISWANGGSGGGGVAIPITVFNTNSSQNYAMQLKYTNPNNYSLAITGLDIVADDNGNGFNATALQIQGKNGATNRALNIVGGDIELNSSAGTSGQALTSAGSGNLPTWTTFPLLSSTQTWTGGNIFNSWTTQAGSMTVTGVITSTAIYVSSATIGTDEYSNGSYVATSTISWVNGNMQKVTLTANTTFLFNAPAHPGTFTLRILTGAGSFTASWPGTVKWSGGTAPTITTTASKVDFCVFKYASDGNYYGSCAGTQNF
jgi:hypothetical protein